MLQVDFAELSFMLLNRHTEYIKGIMGNYANPKISNSGGGRSCFGPVFSLIFAVHGNLRDITQTLGVGEYKSCTIVCSNGEKSPLWVDNLVKHGIFPPNCHLCNPSCKRSLLSLKLIQIKVLAYTNNLYGFLHMSLQTY